MWNDKETDVDFLGYDKIADTVLEIVKDNHLRPLTIGVYGDWGAGKSSVLSLLQKRVQQLPKEEKKIIHTIVFNGWLFQGYDDTKSALMETVVTDLAKLQPAVEKIQKLAKSLLKRINWLKVAKVSASALWTGITGIPNPGAFAGVINTIQKGKDLLGEDEDSSDGFLNDAEETVPSQIHSFREEFKKLIENSKIEQLIILVDDLDRCLPKAVIDILEAIRLFLFVEGTVFVISADEKMIEYAVREHFPNLPSDYTDYTKNYLEKLIQIPIRIPNLNKGQTGNYIKFLMLQNYLDNDLEEVSRIYKHYESKKKFAYEYIDVTYDIVKEVVKDSENLRNTISVADQLYPVLSVGLNGNPRNTKRFLNTLFLRLKIAKIYGLDKIIELEVLAKLMLLERFSNNLYNELITEISASNDGISSKIKEYEALTAEDSDTDLQLYKWCKSKPSLKDKDLRPYIYISKEKAISFDKEQSLTPALLVMLAGLESGSIITLNNVEKQLNSITPQDASLLFDKLIAICRGHQDLSKLSPQMKGIFRLVRAFSQFEIKLLDFLSSKPASALGVWVISENAGIQTIEARQKFNTLLDLWQKEAKGALKTLARQTKRY